MEHRLAYVPFGYTFLTRLHNYRGLAGFLIQEVLPVLLVVRFVNWNSWPITLLSFWLFHSLYEIGYLVNDERDRTAAGEANRLGTLKVQFRSFVIVRAACSIFFFVAISSISTVYSAACSLLLSVFMLALLLAHSRRELLPHKDVRIVTFASLAFYKYIPVFVAALGWLNTWIVTATIFMVYGLPRVLIYTMRKCGDSKIKAQAQTNTAVAGAVLLMTSPLLALAISGTSQGRLVALVWLIYATNWICLALARKARNLIMCSRAAFLPERNGSLDKQRAVNRLSA